ncbi:MAG TPA: helix-turn-helix domain-containing protein [Cyclobacteriaceae bacterium]
MFLKQVLFSMLLLSCLLCKGQVTITVESLPSATPASDTIYITGTFNNWVPNDKAYMLQRLLNGQLGITLPLRGYVEYKFTRGSWTKVETTSNNQYTQNRMLNTDVNKKVFITIENWLDLGGAHMPGYSVLYFFACAFQGIVLLLLIFRLQKNDKQKITAFTIVNCIMILLCSSLVLYEFVNPILQSYITFVLQIVLFCWAPLMLYYIHSFFYFKLLQRLHIWFLPAMLMLVFNILRLFNLSILEFTAQEILPHFTLANTILLGTGILFTAWMHVYIKNQFEFLRSGHTTDNKLNMLKSFYTISVLSLVLMIINVVLLISIPHTLINDYKLVSIPLSTLIFMESYYLWRYPDVMKSERAIVITEPVEVDWLDRLNTIMNEQKPFKNPELNISELAEIMGIKAHTLSRGINDHYQKNFRDFVNTFRIEEFISLADKKEFKHYTFLALAQEVGFNSKSTFNLAFKKATDMSPRDYFKHRIEVTG